MLGLYIRVLGLLKPNAALARTLALANIALAAARRAFWCSTGAGSSRAARSAN
jgi:hypothetical protein